MYQVNRTEREIRVKNEFKRFKKIFKISIKTSSNSITTLLLLLLIILPSYRCSITVTTSKTIQIYKIYPPLKTKNVQTPF